mgnify:CR=1 FL=1
MTKNPLHNHSGNPLIPHDQRIAEFVQNGLEAVVGLDEAANHESSMILPIRDLSNEVSVRFIVIKSRPIIKGSSLSDCLFKRGVQSRGVSGSSASALLFMGKGNKYTYSAVMSRDYRFSVSVRSIKAESVCRWTAPTRKCEGEFSYLYKGMKSYHKGEIYYELGRQN